MTKIDLLITLYNDDNTPQEPVNVSIEIKDDSSYHGPDVAHISDKAKAVIGRLLSDEVKEDVEIVAVNGAGQGWNV